MSTPYEPPARRPLARPGVLVALAAVLVLVAGGITYLLLDRTVFTPERTTFGQSLSVGQCYNEPPGSSASASTASGDGATVIDTVTEVPCTQPHEYEVFAVTDLRGKDTWTQREIDQAADAFCAGRLKVLTIPADAEANAEYAISSPDVADWAKGDRGVQCSVGLGGKTTGSLLAGR